MLPPEYIQQQLERLATSRQTLHYLLQTQTKLGVHTSTGMLHDKDATERDITHIKKSLRDADIEVDDHPDDPFESKKEYSSALPSTHHTHDWSKYTYKLVFSGGVASNFGVSLEKQVYSIDIAGNSVNITYKGWIFQGTLIGTINSRKIEGHWKEFGGGGACMFEFNDDLSKAVGWWCLGENGTKNQWFLERIA